MCGQSSRSQQHTQQKRQDNGSHHHQTYDMRVFTFISSFHLLLASASGIILAWIFVFNDHPWNVDAHANQLLINKWMMSSMPSITDNVTLDGSSSSNRTTVIIPNVDHWLNNLQFENSRNATEAVKQLLLLHYKFSSHCLLLSSILLCFITMLAARNRVLTLMTHIFLLAWLWLFGVVMRPYAEQSLHKRLYLFSLIAGIVALVSYLIHLYLIRNRIIQQQEQERELREQKRKRRLSLESEKQEKLTKQRSDIDSSTSSDGSDSELKKKKSQ